MKIKVSEATKIQIDWMVELAKGTHWSANGYFVFKFPTGTERFDSRPAGSYTTDWSLAGPLIDREKLSLDMLCAPDEWRSALMEGDFYDDQGEWIEGSSHEQTGPTPLIAAMRCFVASKLGDEVEVPDELS